MNRGAGRGAFRPLGGEAGRRLLDALDEGAGDAAAVGRPGRRRGDGHRRRVAVAAFSISIGFLLPIAAPVRFMTASPGDERSPEMKKHAFAAVAASVGVAVGAVSAGALAQDAVQWRVEDGGNGHWYAVETHGPLDWWTAAASAESRGASLVSIDRSEESAWVAIHVLEGVDVSPSSQLWLGAMQSPIGADWRWIDGTAWRYQAWDCGTCASSCQPDGSVSSIGVLQAHCIADGRIQWNDGKPEFTSNVLGSIIEWSADCNADGIVDYGQILAG